MNASNTQSLSALLGGAGLDPSATAAMQLTVDTLGPAIQAGLGDIDYDDLGTAEVLLVTLVIDDSGSIRFVTGNTEAVRDGHNLVIDALKGAKQSAGVLMSTLLLNNGLLFGYTTLDAATRLDSHNFNPGGGTPLFDVTKQALTTVAAKMADFEQNGVAARALTVIVTDGADNGYTRVKDVRDMVDGLLRTEQHIIAGIGVSDGYTDFRQVFSGMGILDEWILTPNNTPSEIRAAFRTVSQSAVRASQTATFSQTAMGGFGG